MGDCIVFILVCSISLQLNTTMTISAKLTCFCYYSMCKKKSFDYHLSFMVDWSSDKLKDLMADDDKCPKHTAAFIAGFCIQRLMR